jgi:hypothetical protein
MEERDSLPKKYMDSFNTGYTFSKHFPDTGKYILEQNLFLAREEESHDELSPIAGMIHGIQQEVKEHDRDLFNEDLKEIDNIRNQREMDQDIDNKEI